MIIYLFLGIFAGTITGLIPGIHSNNISLVLLASPLFGFEAMVFTLAMCTTQSFVDFLPSIFLGAPDTETFEGVLPGHKLLLKGKGLEAICLTVFGGIIALIVGVIFLDFFSIIINNYWDAIKYTIPIVLLFALITIILNENNFRKKLIVVFVILAAGSQGLFFKDQILPLIIGYFGIPTILYSINKSPEPIKQTATVQIDIHSFFDGLVGAIGGAIVAIFPGIGSNLAAAIIRTLKQKIKTENYLVLLGSINTSAFFFSFIVLFFIEKARNGAAIVLKEQIFFITEELNLGIAVMLISGGIGGIITIYLSKKIIHFFSGKKIKVFSIFSIIVMISSVFVFNGFYGLFVLLFSSALGFFVVLQKVSRSSSLASLIIPTVFFYLFILY